MFFLTCWSNKIFCKYNGLKEPIKAPSYLPNDEGGNQNKESEPSFPLLSPNLSGWK